MTRINSVPRLVLIAAFSLLMVGCFRPAPTPTLVFVGPAPTNPGSQPATTSDQLPQGTIDLATAQVIGNSDPNQTPLFPTIEGVPTLGGEVTIIAVNTGTIGPVETISPNNPAVVPVATSPAVLPADPLRPYPENADSAQDIAAALVTAAAENKYVIVDFGANWCPGCVLLSTYYQTEPLRSLIDQKFRVVRVDIGRYNKNQALIAQYGNITQTGIPAIAIVQPPGYVLYSTARGELAPLPNLPINQVYSVIAAYQPG